MFLSSFTIVATTICLLHLVPAAANFGKSPNQYLPVEDFAVNCGFSANSTALDGREWIGDGASNFVSTSQQSVVSSTTVNPLFVDWIPYMIARISRSEFTYRFRVRAGQKFIRLHFHPASYRGFEKSKALFDVRAGPYILLTNFSTSLTADALGVQYFVKEYCVNVKKDDEILSITFSPSQGRNTDDIYAFINGIEIVSMPTALYYSGDDDLGARVAGEKFRFYIENRTALELVYRLNVGGRTILPLHDLGMHRLWSEDKNYLLELDVLPMSTPIMIKYSTDKWKFAGPLKLYQTAWAKASNPRSNQRYNYTWKLPVDLGFRYLVRLHFCNPELETTEDGGKKFVIFINNVIAESEGDVRRWSGGSGIAMYRDYVVSMEGRRSEGKCDFFIVLQPMYERRDAQIEAMMMNGIEIFKLSNLDNDLASPNPISISKNGKSKFRKLVFALGHANAIATAAFVILTLLNIIVFQLNIWKSNDGQLNISSSSSLPTEDEEEEQGCRLFSLVEIQLATNNFDEKFVIGRGGFGKVYRGLMDGGTRFVAIKRLNPESKQGAEEFWAEVETLSKFQHAHLVSLLGYYEDRREMLLVYEYVSGGSLADLLFRTWGNSTSSCPLSWEQRLNICIGAARGLNYLHTGRGEPYGVIHRDVKSSNILLDPNLEAKISDFGLCKMFGTRPAGTHVTTKVKGTFGFMDPEYFVTQRLTFKSDVYAFGVVLLEVLCGRPALDRRVGEDKHCLTLWVRQCITEGRVDQIVDPSLKDQISGRCLRVFVQIACKCLCNRPNERPTMGDLVSGLEHALELQARPDSYAEEEEVATVEQQSIVDSYIGESGERIIDQENINATLVDSPMLHGDHSQTSESFNRNETEVSTAPKTSSNDKKGKDDRKRKMNNSSNRRPHWKWWNSIWRRSKPSKIEAIELPEALCHRFSLSEILAATDNFNPVDVIGEGGFSKVYKGYIVRGNRVVAIKRYWSLGSRNAVMDFQTEIETLSQLRHVNLVSLLGYCYEGSEMIVVYDYISKGTLRDHLYGNPDNDPLLWEQRLQICVGAAKGLHYLHSGAPIKTIHRDIKSPNILLDEKLLAKISDFGLSKYDPTPLPDSCFTTVVKGTIGYLDPEYLGSGRLSEKSDVFSFGVVLLEVLCAREPWNIRLREDEISLASWVKSCIRSNTLHQIIDPYLAGKIAPECLRRYVDVAQSCLRDSWKDRPPMADVVGGLQLALHLQQTAEATLQDTGLVLDNMYPEEEVEEVEAVSSYTGNSPRLYNDFSSVEDMNMRVEMLPVPEGICRRFSFAEIRAVANNFSTDGVIGEGYFGKVHKGCIGRDNRVVAIKRWSLGSRNAVMEFQTEIETLSRVRHVNLVSLLGYCDEGNEMIVVYDYMSKGNLRDRLYGNQCFDPLLWEQRLQICIGAAQGLHYLHSGAPLKIIHHDVNSTNILLDEEFVAKIAAFGRSKADPPTMPDCGIGTADRGTIGYIDPEYVASRRLMEKSDVYSFGVVLLEVLCARKPVDFMLREDERFLANWVKSCIRSNTIDKIIDPCLAGKIAPECLRWYVEVAQSCLRRSGNERPPMADVVDGLQFALQLQQTAEAAMQDTEAGTGGGFFLDNLYPEEAESSWVCFGQHVS